MTKGFYGKNVACVSCRQAHPRLDDPGLPHTHAKLISAYQDPQHGLKIIHQVIPVTGQSRITRFRRVTTTNALVVRQFPHRFRILPWTLSTGESDQLVPQSTCRDHAQYTTSDDGSSLRPRFSWQAANADNVFTAEWCSRCYIWTR